MEEEKNELLKIYKIFGIFGIFTVSMFAFVGYIARTIISQVLSRDIESFKNKLEMQAFEHQIRFAKLHETTAIVIAELYKRIEIANSDIRNYIKGWVLVGESPEEERRKEAIDSYNEMVRYFRQNAIYFDEETHSKVDKFIKDCKETIFDFQYKEDMASKEKSKTRIWFEIEKRFVNEVGLLKEELRKAFKNILGVKEKNKKSET